MREFALDETPSNASYICTRVTFNVHLREALVFFFRLKMEIGSGFCGLVRR